MNEHLPDSNSPNDVAAEASRHIAIVTALGGAAVTFAGTSSVEYLVGAPEAVVYSFLGAGVIAAASTFVTFVAGYVNRRRNH